MENDPNGPDAGSSDSYEGYYDYGPRVLLERLALVGFMGASAALTGHAMACRLGLPLLAIDRMVEHEAGMSLSQLQRRRGELSRRTLELKALRRASRERPAGIVVVGDGALMAPPARALVRSHMQLVYIHRPMGALTQAVATELATDPGRYPELGDATASGLAKLFDERKPGYLAADHTIDAGTLHPQRVADALVRDLALL